MIFLMLGLKRSVVCICAFSFFCGNGYGLRGFRLRFSSDEFGRVDLQLVGDLSEDKTKAANLSRSR